MKFAIFTYYNFQINPEISKHQHAVIQKLLAGTTHIDFMPLHYNGKDGDVYPDQAINYGINELFNNGYDNVLILDVDCIPLSIEAIAYTFGRATQGYLVGNAQRSHYIENDEHLFIGSSCLCLSKTTFEKLGKPDFCPTSRGDIAEELTYLAEEKNIPIEMYLPESYEASPAGAASWALKGDLPHYGIGTTFKNDTSYAKFYHLFESRHNLNVDRFIAKCMEILKSDK